MKCETCGYELPRNGSRCRVCWNAEQWEEEDRYKVMERLFSRRIVRELQSLDTALLEEDVQILLSGNGLFLYGYAGTGKTLYACSAVLEYLRRCFVFPEYPRRQVKFISTPNLLEEIRASFNVSKAYRSDDEEDEEERKTTKEILDYYSSIDLLLLDDLGAEKPTEWSLQIIQILINNRYEEVLPTIITSNLGLKALSEQLDDRIASRIYEMCEIRDFGTQDHRLKRTRK